MQNQSFSLGIASDATLDPTRLNLSAPRALYADTASAARLIWASADRGEAQRARAMCDAERDTAQRSGNPLRIAVATRIHGELLALRGAGDVAQSEFLRALELANHAGDTAEEVRIRTALARVLAFDGPFEEAESVARSAYDMAATADDQRGRIQALAAWGRARLARGEIKESIPLFFRAMRAARKSRDDLTLRDAWVDLALALTLNGRSRMAIRLLNSANTLAERDGLKRQALLAQMGLARAHLTEINSPDALAFTLSAIGIANSYGYEGYLPVLYSLLGEVYTQMEDYQGAYHAIRQQVDAQHRRLASQRRHILMLSSLLIDAQGK